MPGAKCIVPWCERFCTTVVCALCRERIGWIKIELGGVKFGERPEAYRLLWDLSRNEFTIRQTAVISGIPKSTIRARILKENPEQRRKTVRGGSSYALSRYQVITVAKGAEQFRRHRRLYLSLSAAAILIGVHRETIKKVIKKHNIPVARAGRYVFLDPEFVERIKLEKVRRERNIRKKRRKKM